MTYQHDAQLANIVTSYCTCLAGLLPLILTGLTVLQPPRWLAVYACVLITGVPTVWLHSVEGNRIASFFDVGTNILLAWVLIVAVSGDYMSPLRRRMILSSTGLANLGVLGWLLWEIVAPEKVPVITFGEFGQFYLGEVALIANAWIGLALFVANRRNIAPTHRRILYLMTATFLVGMFMATAGNSQVTAFILPWHAMWHIVSAQGFIILWFFNHERFRTQSLDDQSHPGSVPLTPQAPLS
ncbi:MAG: hypothetical protein AMXMBFR84_20040 [Candidatus Hydrogenedentota bacterium]